MEEAHERKELGCPAEGSLPSRRKLLTGTAEMAVFNYRNRRKHQKFIPWTLVHTAALVAQFGIRNTLLLRDAVAFQLRHPGRRFQPVKARPRSIMYPYHRAGSKGSPGGSLALAIPTLAPLHPWKIRQKSPHMGFHGLSCQKRANSLQFALMGMTTTSHRQMFFLSSNNWVWLKDMHQN